MAPKRKRWLILVAVVVIVAAAVAYAARTKGNGNGEDEKGPEIPTLAASIDDVQVVVREVGTVEPEVKVEIKSNLGQGGDQVQPLWEGGRPAGARR